MARTGEFSRCVTILTPYFSSVGSFAGFSISVTEIETGLSRHFEGFEPKSPPLSVDEQPVDEQRFALTVQMVKSRGH